MVLTALLTTGCAGHGKVQETCYNLASQGQVDESLERLEESALARQERDRLLYLMEKGTLLHLQGTYRKSNEVFEEADRLFEDLFTRSVTAETFSFATNDTVIPYAGADYESVYLNYYKILNYLALGEISGAAVEARRIDEKLNWLSDRYGDSHSFQEDAFLRLLSGFIYEALGDANNALVAYRKSLQVFEANEEMYGVAVPQLIWPRLAVSARRTGLLDEAREYVKMAGDNENGSHSGDGIVVVIVNNGAIPRKFPVRAVFPSGHGFPVTLTVPDFAPSSFGAEKIRVSLDGKRWQETEITENLSAVARRSLEDRKGRVLGKAIARVVTKQLAARQAREEIGPLAELIAQFFALATEQADLRSWTTLPREVRTAVLAVPPGEHRVTLQLGAQQRTQEVTVPSEGVAFVFTRVF